MSKEPKLKDNPPGDSPGKTGLHNRLDTGQLRALDGITLDELTERPPPPGDPYNWAAPPALDSTQKQKRRSLDDMRRMSEEIKANRSGTTAVLPQDTPTQTAGEGGLDTATATQIEAIAEVVRDALAQLNLLLMLETSKIDASQRQRLEDAAQQLRDAIQYLDA